MTRELMIKADEGSNCGYILSSTPESKVGILYSPHVTSLYNNVAHDSIRASNLATVI